MDTPKASAAALGSTVLPLFGNIRHNRAFHRIDGCTEIPKILDADMLYQHNNLPLLLVGNCNVSVNLHILRSKIVVLTENSINCIVI